MPQLKWYLPFCFYTEPFCLLCSGRNLWIEMEAGQKENHGTDGIMMSVPWLFYSLFSWLIIYRNQNSGSINP